MLDPIPDAHSILLRQTFRQQIVNSTPTYWYVGYCPHSGELLKLPRTQEVENIARNLMLELARDDRYSREGKMYGVLLVETNTGEYYSIKAFSGLLNSEAIIAGWVPPIPGRDRVAIEEAATLEALATMKQELIDLDRTTEREQYRSISAEFVGRVKQLSIEHRQRKAFRQQQRERYESTLNDLELTTALDQLIAQSCQDGRERDRLKQERDAILHPLKAILDQNDDRIRELKQRRKLRSRQLQTQMHDAYQLMNFLGTSSSLRELMPAGIPTGTGDCCAPKLLHYAASHQLKPISMAEFWWGENSQDKCQGEFYGACQERCQPLMGFMLSGLAVPIAVSGDLGGKGKGEGGKGRNNCEIIYEDEYLIAIDKPAGLLSVPGRTIDLQDSVLTRLRKLYPEIYTVHRLDRDTSGILLLALDKLTYRHLSQQFEERQIHKIYEAILGGIVEIQQGSIDLPLWGDPLDRPRQKVDFNLGKPSLTKFQVLGQIGSYTRIEFMPVTGRSHQLRVHAADFRGLGVAVLGDRLYSCQADVERLHLHARELSFIHPHTLARISLQTQCPF
ncbi:RluA family pseudouridine synthase [Chamaesiphon sp. VAR_48_metabat_135_sub]|uniref:RluA family pseudouridine synthase n=1 Tax=Chamaesiphon sp. VAR_48_metabat_135_sub TaxID=2964699 RepID=UPI00286BE183|nr:RluA family pseudouridine synthase [Chamaesiphon sp. VAR_48_metabat_135_sub]